MITPEQRQAFAEWNAANEQARREYHLWPFADMRRTKFELAEAERDPWSLVDGCPVCVNNTEPPWNVVTCPQVSDHCSYTCSDCGHTWTTDWAR